MAYNTVVRLQLEYAAAVWHAHTKNKSKQVEKVQHRAARWVSCYYVSVYRTWLKLWVGKRVQVGNDQEKAQSERHSNSKNRGGKTKLTIYTYTQKIYRKLSE